MRWGRRNRRSFRGVPCGSPRRPCSPFASRSSGRFDVAKNRYAIGRIDTGDLYIAQSEKDAALLSYVEALRNFWLAYYRLRRLTLCDFEAAWPLAQDPPVTSR